MRPLRQATAGQLRMVGPFVDDTDFKTPETGLTIANTDVKINVNGAAGQNKDSGGGTHRNNGMYALTFNEIDSATVGSFEGSIAVAGALVVPFYGMVLEAAVWDALYADGATGYALASELALVKAAAIPDIASVLVAVLAIKAKTDPMTYDVANLLNVNVKRLFNIVLGGTGVIGDPFQP